MTLKVCVLCVACMSCGASFNVLRRRHHCRGCGEVVCHTCSTHRVELSHMGIKGRVRVCDCCACEQFQAERYQNYQDYADRLDSAVQGRADVRCLPVLQRRAGRWLPRLLVFTQRSTLLLSSVLLRDRDVLVNGDDSLRKPRVAAVRLSEQLRSVRAVLDVGEANKSDSSLSARTRENSRSRGRSTVQVRFFQCPYAMALRQSWQLCGMSTERAQEFIPSLVIADDSSLTDQTGLIKIDNSSVGSCDDSCDGSSVGSSVGSEYQHCESVHLRGCSEDYAELDDDDVATHRLENLLRVHLSLHRLRAEHAEHLCLTYRSLMMTAVTWDSSEQSELLHVLFSR
ncbi:MAG: hypothetical protein MHM6MM_007705, partial [Cercozoa sp. M6MM]